MLIRGNIEDAKLLIMAQHCSLRASGLLVLYARNRPRIKRLLGH